MTKLALVIGWMLAAFIGLLGITVIWLIISGKINLSKLISEPSGDASLSRFQFLIFTFVIAMCLFLLTIKSGSFPSVSPEILALLGISGGSYVISKGIQASWDTRKNEEKGDDKNKNKEATKHGR